MGYSKDGGNNTTTVIKNTESQSFLRSQNNQNNNTNVSEFANRLNEKSELVPKKKIMDIYKLFENSENSNANQMESKTKENKCFDLNQL